MWELPDPRTFDSLLDLLEDAARRYKGKRQLALRTDEGTQLPWSAQELQKRAKLVAWRLRALGLQPGDRLLTWSPATPALPAVYFGAMYAGIIVVPLDLRMAPEVLRRIADASGARWLVIGTGFDAPDAEAGGLAHFEKAHFTEYAHFDNTHFRWGARFNNAIFAGTSVFYEAHFEGTAVFNDATFTERASFSSGQFRDLTFFKTQFARDTDFHGARFCGNTSFQGARTEGAINLHQAIARCPNESHTWPDPWYVNCSSSDGEKGRLTQRQVEA
jgi:acyl-CoA synthetase (AMP-forming)/AMP-acid ligase II